jgi:biotin carboxylase
VTTRRRVLLLAPARSYRAADFMLAAVKMGVDLTVASDGAVPVGGRPVIPVRPGDQDRAAGQVITASGPVDAVIAADTPMLLLAAVAAARLGLPHNPASAVLAASDKTRQRQLWAAAGVCQPRFAIIPAHAAADAIARAATAVGFPCVVKAVSLSASQGVLRAGDATEAVQAATRIRGIAPANEPLLAEEYLSGPELSIDGLLHDNDGWTPLAVFDKPATPGGPTFEETLLVTPSRLSAQIIDDATGTAGHAARALGLRTGPVHAELRITPAGPAMLELAARSIGGLCSRALRFPGGRTLEELIIASALGDPPPTTGPPAPCGIFMLPVPRAGVLRAVEGRAAAESVPGITGVTLTIAAGRQVRPLPDGDQYLGFIFAEAATPDEAEKALTAASQHLHAIID